MSEIDTYLETVDPTKRVYLEEIRRRVKQLVPEAKECIAYGMPTLKYKDKPLLHFAAFKDHMSVFPTADPALDNIVDYQKFRTSKGTLQFTEDNPIPDELITAIVTVRKHTIDTGENEA